MDAGAVDFLSKPLSDERLISCLDAAVKGDASDQE
jgi:FixJ family two-component response regulator